MNVAAPLQRFGRSYGVPWRSGEPAIPSVVAISADVPLRLDRDPLVEVAGVFKVQRAGNSSSICQVDWRVEGLTGDPVLPEHFVGGVLPSGTAFFGDGDLEVSASVLLSPGLDPARESSGHIVLENPVNCALAVGGAEIPLSIVAEPVVPGDAIVGLDVPFNVIELDPITPTGDYALGPDWSANWTLQRANTARSRITQEDDGVVLTSDAGVDDSSIFLFAKLAPPAKWELTCKYTWLDGLEGEPGGTFTRFGYVRGIGTGGIEANPNLWSTADAGDLSDVRMDSQCVGVRASVNTKNSGGMAGLSNQVRIRCYDPDVPDIPAIDPGGDNTFTFVDDIEYTLKIKREGNTMTFTKSAPATLTQSVPFVGPEIGAIGEAWICWAAVSGRRCRIRDLTLVEIP